MRECGHDLGRAILAPIDARNALARFGWRHYPPSGVTGPGWDCVSGWAGPDLSPLVVHRHTDDLSDLRRWLLWRAETDMVQDPADRDGVGGVGKHLERATAASADERIRLKELGDQPR